MGGWVGNVIEHVLFELLNVLYRPLNWCWSLTDSLDDNPQQKSHHRGILLSIADQLRAAQMNRGEVQTELAFATMWIQAGREGHVWVMCW